MTGSNTITHSTLRSRRDPFRVSPRSAAVPVLLPVGVSVLVSVLLSALMLAATILVVGCSHAPRHGAEQRVQPTPVQRPPADMTLSVTVADPSLGPARFIVEPDGQLRAAVGTGATRDVYPARTRRLSQAEMSDLFGRVARAGLSLAVDEPTQAASMRAPGIVVVLIANGERRIATHDARTSQDAASLVAHLRRLSRLEG
ncbi:MAG: hypothetical protein AAFR96_01425 [Planctomycetota bacterium]